MLLRFHRIVRRCLAAALLTTAAFTLPSSASAAGCPTQPTTKAFSAFGDDADYALAPGGNFESGPSGWKFTNARIVTGNETAGVLPGSRSVAMGSSWMATGPSGLTSPWFCVNADHPYFRYLIKPNGPVGLLATFVRYKDTKGQIVQEQVKSKISTNLFPGKWAPSELNPLSVNLPISGDQTAQVQLVFVTPFSVMGAGYFIDDVLVDPYRRG